jgi:hypothetical protein
LYDHAIKSILNWRHPLVFATRIKDYLVAGGQSIVDVIDSATGKIVHVFETKRDKIRSLRLLVGRDHVLYLLAQEEREATKTVAVIMVELF